MPDTVISFCHAGTVQEMFMQSVINLIFHDVKGSRRVLSVSSIGGSYIATSRNMLVKDFLKGPGEWMLSLDNDMVFTADLLDKLLSYTSEDRKIVAAFYLNYYENAMILPTWLEFNQEGKLSTCSHIERDQVMEVASVGMGGTLIHRSVFEAMQEKYKDDPWTWFGHDLWKGDRLGEDVTFCIRARECGFKSYGCTEIQMGHIKNRMLDISTLITKEKINPL